MGSLVDESFEVEYSCELVLVVVGAMETLVECVFSNFGAVFVFN